MNEMKKNKNTVCVCVLKAVLWAVSQMYFCESLFGQLVNT